MFLLFKSTLQFSQFLKAKLIELSLPTAFLPGAFNIEAGFVLGESVLLLLILSLLNCCYSWSLSVGNALRF